MNEQEERDAREAAEECLECALRKANRLVRGLENLIEMVDNGDSWSSVSFDLVYEQLKLADIDRELENAIKIADENCPPPENTPDKILASGRKALAKPKKPQAKKVPAKNEKISEINTRNI